VQSLTQFLLQCKKDGIAGMKLYDKYSEFLESKCRTAKVPWTGVFEITPMCNLDCKMCYVHLNRQQMHEHDLLSLEQWKLLAGQAIDAGMMNATITGGECLTVPWFSEFYLFLRDRGIGVTVKTNGSLICGELLDLFIMHPPTLLNVTVYGADDDGYEAVTGHRVFCQVMQNLEMLRKNGVALFITITPNEYMKDGVKLLRVLSEHGFRWAINPTLNTPNQDTGRTLHEASNDAYLELFRESQKLQGQFTNTECPDVLPDVGSEGNCSVPIRCAAGRSSFAVNWKGELLPCISFPGATYDALSLGFNEAWRRIGEVIDTFRMPVECVQCAYRNHCSTCIKLHDVCEFDGHANPAICERTKYMVANGLLKLE